MNSKPKIIIFSQVYPFPLISGQNQRIANTLNGLKEYGFHITFFTVGRKEEIERIKDKLKELCDEVILLESKYLKNLFTKWSHKIIGIFYTLVTGNKFSNYLISNVELTPNRVEEHLKNNKYDFALFEYWHTHKLVPLLRNKNIPCVIDIHNILWRNWEFYLNLRAKLPNRWEPMLPGFIKRKMVKQYRLNELNAYLKYDCLITLGAEEVDYLSAQGIANHKLLKMPMGISLDKWNYCWSCNDKNKKIVYYGSLNNPYNVKDVLFLYHQFMPKIWSEFENAELWLVGSNPTQEVRKLTQNPKVTVTGFVDDLSDVLKDKHIMVMPFSGASGFRSRLIEVMALGLPILTSKEVVKQMDIKEYDKFLLAKDNQQLSVLALKLLNDEKILMDQSLSGRKFVEQQYSFDATYGRLPDYLLKMRK